MHNGSYLNIGQLPSAAAAPMIACLSAVYHGASRLCGAFRGMCVRVCLPQLLTPANPRTTVNAGVTLTAGLVGAVSFGTLAIGTPAVYALGTAAVIATAAGFINGAFVGAAMRSELADEEFSQMSDRYQRLLDISGQAVVAMGEREQQTHERHQDQVNALQQRLVEQHQENMKLETANGQLRHELLEGKIHKNRLDTAVQQIQVERALYENAKEEIGRLEDRLGKALDTNLASSNFFKQDNTRLKGENAKLANERLDFSLKLMEEQAAHRNLQTQYKRALSRETELTEKIKEQEQRMDDISDEVARQTREIAQRDAYIELLRNPAMPIPGDPIQRTLSVNRTL